MEEKAKRQPNIRFRGFNNDWQREKLGEVLSIATRKNGDLYTKKDVLSVSDEFGCVNQIEFQGRSFAAEDVSNYKIVESDDIVYTRSPLQAKPYGIIKLVGNETGIVSPLYIVNVAVKGNCSKFIYYNFDTPQKTNNYLSPLVRKGAKNTMNVSNDEWLSGNIFIAPSYSEQQKIGEFFATLDKLINLHRQELDLLKKAKRTLLAKMFPQKGKKVPQLRFKGFTDDWQLRKISDIAEIVGGGTPSTKDSRYWNGDIDWYVPAEINECIYANGSQRKITELGLKNSSAKLLPAHRTILFTSRAGIGKTAILKSSGSTNQGFQSMILKEDICPYFIYSMTDIIKNKAERISYGSTFSEISGKALGKLEFVAPSYSEQQKIGEFFAMLDKLINLRRREFESLKIMKKSLLKAMFI